MRKLIIVLLFMLPMLSGCDSELGVPVNNDLPYFEYKNSNYYVDPYNRRIPVESGYVLDMGHSYDIIETENGYDIVFHMIKGDIEK